MIPKVLPQLLCGLLLCGVLEAAQAAAPAIPLYHATYSAGRGSLRVGTARFSLTRNDDGSYTYRSVTKPAGLMALFFDDVVTETSRFTLAGDHLQSLHYSYQHRSDDGDKLEQIRFDWSKGLAYSSEGASHQTVLLTAGICDRLLAQLAMSLDALQGKPVNDYSVLDHAKVQMYRFMRTGNASVNTPAGKYDTVEMTRHDDSKNRVTTFWLAPKLDYLPVRIRQTEPGKATISLVLTDISFDAAKSGK